MADRAGPESDDGADPSTPPTSSTDPTDLAATFPARAAELVGLGLLTLDEAREIVARLRGDAEDT